MHSSPPRVDSLHAPPQCHDGHVEQTHTPHASLFQVIMGDCTVVLGESAYDRVHELIALQHAYALNIWFPSGGSQGPYSCSAYRTYKK